MQGVPLFSDSSFSLEFKSISTAMFASSSPEELLQIFLTNLGEKLVVSRVAIYQLTNQQEGIVLLEAVAPIIPSIKNRIYPITYFGIDSSYKYPKDRAVSFADVSEITETLTVHQRWQNSQLRAMISAPIMFDALPDQKINSSKIWGLAFVQQCDQPRQWQSREVNFLFDLSQVLGKCLQTWASHQRSPESLISEITKPFEQEEFIAKRIYFPASSNILSTDSNFNDDEDIQVFSDLLFSVQDQNKNLDRGLSQSHEAKINDAVNLAMQRLEQRKLHPAKSYPQAFTEMNIPETDYDLDLEASTIENILEAYEDEDDDDDPAIAKLLINHDTQIKIDYLQQKVESLLEAIQGKIIEIDLLHQQIKLLSTTQQEFRQILLALQSEPLPTSLQKSILAMYLSLENTN
jgi:hypothetical protein